MKKSRLYSLFLKKTINKDLDQFGFPESPYGMIVSTSSGFITESALIDYIKKYVGPQIVGIKKKFGLEDERALLIQDGMTAHITPGVKSALNAFSIDVFQIPAHSSHLTQPLDQGTFSAFKNEMKKNYNNSKVNSNLLNYSFES